MSSLSDHSQMSNASCSMKQFFCAVSAVDTNKRRLRWHLHHSPSSSPLSVSLRCIKGLWCYLCRGMPKECAVLTTTLYVRMETELSVVRGWCWFSLCKCIQVNLIWCTMLRPDTPGSWLFSWLIALLRGRDHVRGNCKKALSHTTRPDLFDSRVDTGLCKNYMNMSNICGMLS